MQSEKLGFEKVKKDIVAIIKERITYHTQDFGTYLKVREKEIAVGLPNVFEELIFKRWYGANVSPKISGNVLVRILPKNMFRDRGEFIYYAFSIKQYGGSKTEDKIVGKGHLLVRHEKYAELWAGAAKVSPGEYMKIATIPEEDRIVKAVEAAARLSKSLSRHVVPVTSISSGEIIDYASIGYDDLLFIELLRYILARERMGSVA